MTEMIVDAFGIRHTASPADVGVRLGTGRFFWLDIFGGETSDRTHHLTHLDLDPADMAWALRFGQVGRMQLSNGKLRAVTWLAQDDGKLIEVHVFCSQKCILTIWQGDTVTLDEIRLQFSERVGNLEDRPFHAAAILLQLMLGTIDHLICQLDAGLDDVRIRIDREPSPADFAMISKRLQKLRVIISGFSRYNSAVHSAIVGIESIAGIDPQSAAELNDYAEQVEDVED